MQLSQTPEASRQVEDDEFIGQVAGLSMKSILAACTILESLTEDIRDNMTRMQEQSRLEYVEALKRLQACPVDWVEFARQLYLQQTSRVPDERTSSNAATRAVSRVFELEELKLVAKQAYDLEHIAEEFLRGSEGVDCIAEQISKKRPRASFDRTPASPQGLTRSSIKMTPKLASCAKRFADELSTMRRIEKARTSQSEFVLLSADGDRPFRLSSVFGSVDPSSKLELTKQKCEDDPNSHRYTFGQEQEEWHESLEDSSGTSNDSEVEVDSHSNFQAHVVLKTQNSECEVLDVMVEDEEDESSVSESHADIEEECDGESALDTEGEEGTEVDDSEEDKRGRVFVSVEQRDDDDGVDDDVDDEDDDVDDIDDDLPAPPRQQESQRHRPLRGTGDMTRTSSSEKTDAESVEEDETTLHEMSDGSETCFIMGDANERLSKGEGDNSSLSPTSSYESPEAIIKTSIANISSPTPASPISLKKAQINNTFNLNALALKSPVSSTGFMPTAVGILKTPLVRIQEKLGAFGRSARLPAPVRPRPFSPPSAPEPNDFNDGIPPQKNETLQEVKTGLIRSFHRYLQPLGPKNPLSSADIVGINQGFEKRVETSTAVWAQGDAWQREVKRQSKWNPHSLFGCGVQAAQYRDVFQTPDLRRAISITRQMQDRSDGLATRINRWDVDKEACAFQESEGMTQEQLNKMISLLNKTEDISDLAYQAVWIPCMADCNHDRGKKQPWYREEVIV